MCLRVLLRSSFFTSTMDGIQKLWCIHGGLALVSTGYRVNNNTIMLVNTYYYNLHDING